jgi:carbon-monoxide dehydrogenase medium subunit
VLAGGQSLMPLLAFRLAAPSLLVDLRRLPRLGDIVSALVRAKHGEQMRRTRAAARPPPAARVSRTCAAPGAFEIGDLSLLGGQFEKNWRLMR